MQKFKKRVISGVLSLTMVLSLVMSPTSVSATDLATNSDPNVVETTTQEVSTENTETATSENSTDTTTEEVTTTETVTTEETSTTEETTEEETTEEETTEETPETVDASTLAYRLIVGTSDDTILTNGVVISSLDDLYIIGYATEEERNSGIEYYTPIADLVEKDDSIFKVADEKDVHTDTEATEVVNSDDAFTNLEELEVSEEVVKADKVIAVIDTGASKEQINGDNVINAVSVIGESGEDDNGHGSEMIDIILKENPNAKILSIKALNDNGDASASDIYASIQYAIDNKVDIINLSLSAYNTEENSIVKDIIKEAIDKKIVVIGSAGNKSKNIKYYIPGCVEEAIIIGSADENGNPLDSCNYGTTIDYYVTAESTSKATAYFTGVYSTRNTLENINNIQKNIFIVDLSQEFFDEKEMMEIIEKDEKLYDDSEIREKYHIDGLADWVLTTDGNRIYAWPLHIKIPLTITGQWGSALGSRWLHTGSGRDGRTFSCGTHLSYTMNGSVTFSAPNGSYKHIDDITTMLVQDTYPNTADVTFEFCGIERRIINGVLQPYDYTANDRKIENWVNNHLEVFCTYSSATTPHGNTTMILTFADGQYAGNKVRYDGGGNTVAATNTNNPQTVGGYVTLTQDGETTPSYKFTMQKRLNTGQRVEKSTEGIVYALCGNTRTFNSNGTISGSAEKANCIEHYRNTTGDYAISCFGYFILGDNGLPIRFIPTYGIDPVYDYGNNTISSVNYETTTVNGQTFPSLAGYFKQVTNENGTVYANFKANTDWPTWKSSLTNHTSQATEGTDGMFYLEEVDPTNNHFIETDGSLRYASERYVVNANSAGYKNYIVDPTISRAVVDGTNFMNLEPANGTTFHASNSGMSLAFITNDRPDDHAYGFIQAVKYDPNNENVQGKSPFIKGAKFRLTKNGNANFLMEGTTGDDGVYNFFGLTSGTYVLTEIQAPTGYALPPANKRSTTITIKADMTTTYAEWTTLLSQDGSARFIPYYFYDSNYYNSNGGNAVTFPYSSTFASTEPIYGIMRGMPTSAVFDVRSYYNRYKSQLSALRAVTLPGTNTEDSSASYSSVSSSYNKTMSTDYIDGSWIKMYFHFAINTPTTSTYATLSDTQYKNLPEGITYSNNTHTGSGASAIVKVIDDQIPITVVKTRKASCAPIYNNNPAYSLEGTEIAIYDSLMKANIHGDNYIAKFVLNADGSINFNATTVKTGATKDNNKKKILLDTNYANLYAVELKAGKGYILNQVPIPASKNGNIQYEDSNGNPIYNLDNPITITIENEPKRDPMELHLKKVNVDGSEYTNDGNINPNGAIYQVEQYYCTSTQYFVGGQNPVATAQYTTKTHNNKPGSIYFLTDKETSTSKLNYLEEDNHIKFPIGFYVIKEVQAPEGLLLSDDVFYCEIKEDPNNPQSTSTLITYWKSEKGQTPTITNGPIQAGNNVDPVVASTKEPVIWYNLALVKDDKEKGKNSPQGIGTLDGAEYYIYTTDNTIFNHRNEYEGHTYSVDAQNRILVDGNILKITTDANGFGETPYPIIWSDKSPYYTIEAKASKGYVLNTNTYTFTKPETRLITSGANKGSREIVKKTIPNTNYSVDTYVNVQNQADYNHVGHHPELPIRGDLDLTKYNIDGYSMAYIPFLVSMLDADGNVLEQHVIITDANGKINTKSRNNKTKLTVNTLDAYYNANSKSYTGGLTNAEASVNIWFGDIAEYEKDTSVNNNRGSLLYGNYKIEELRCANNTGHELLQANVTVAENDSIVNPGKVMIDLDIIITSDAIDTISDSKSVTISETAKLSDTLSIDHLKVGHKYRIKTFIYNIVEGQDPILMGTSDYKEFIPTANGNMETINNYSVESTVTLDTTNAVPGSYIALEDRLYEEIDGSFPTSDDDYISIHNRDYNEESQKLFVPDMTTEAFNDSTNRLRIGSIEPPSEIDDTITYENLGNKTFYKFNTTIVYDDGSIVKDVNGNDCTCDLKMYTDDRYTQVFLRDGMIVGPTSGSFKLSDVGIAPFVISAPNTTFYITEKLDSLSYDAETGTPIYKTIVSHNLDKDEEIETIRYVKIQTTAGSVKTGVEGISIQGLIPNNTEATLRDIITYTNVAQDVEVVIEGQVVEKDNPENIVATNSKTMALPTTLGDSQGTTYMDFTFDSTPYADKKLVVFERVYLVQDGNKVLISEHCDVNDENQIVRVPDVHTTLNSVVNHEKYKVTKNYGEITVIDTVEYKNVKPGIPYTLNAILYDKQTNQPAVDFEGNTITKSVTFTPDAENGFKDVEMTFTSVLRGTDWETDDGYVAFEELKGHDDVTYAVHNDIEDEGQTVRNPKFKTKAINLKETKYIVAAPNQKITDIVTLRNFDKAKLEGDTFTLVIKAVNAETGEDLTDTDGNVYTNSKTFVWNGQTEEPIDIIIDATGLEGKTIVFYEDLYYGDTPSEETELLREHTQDSHLQSVYIPYIGTQATDAEINIQLLALNRQLKDVIDLKNLIPNTDYKIVTKIWDKTTQRFVKTLEDTEYEYVSDYHSPSNNIEENDYTNANYSVNDTVEITMDLSNVEDIAGHDIVVFEYMYDSDNDFYAEHAKEEAPEQTLQVPDGHTTALAEDTNDHITVADEHTHIIDTIHYENLIPNIEYTVTGTVMLREEIDGEITAVPLKDKDGKVVTTTTTFVPTEKTGDDLTVEFDIDTTKLQNKTLVIFEDMLYNDVTIFVHHDISDEEQSIHIPDGHTTALDNKTKDHIAYPEEKMSFIDTITYSNLLPNKKYTAIGTIMVVDGKKTYELKDKKGKVITSKVTFTANEPNGTVEVPFEIDATLLKGKTIVVFEDVSYNNITVFVHHDIEDTEQTIKFPSGHTTAVDSNTKEHMAVANKDTVIIDTIHYENLIPNKKYTATGTLYSVKTGKPYEVDGKTFSKTVTFTPSEPNGDVEVPIKMSTKQLEGSTIVVFEDVYYNDKLVFMHHELKDENQSVHITKLRTKATDKVDNDNIIDGTSQEQTIIDTVKYENLIKGKKYTVVGKLVIKPTEEQLKDANYKPEYVLDENNKPLEAKVTFVADKPNGEIQVPFTIDASKYAGKKLVAFESVSYNKKEIAVHADVNDEEQTITVSLRLHVKIAKADKDNIKYYLKNAEITIFNQDGTIAKDIDGKDCVGVTNENGEVDFTILYNENNTYYAQETKAPNGYNLNKDKFEIKPSGDKETLGTDLIKINILDSIIVIPPKKTPPKTDDIINIVFVMSLIGLGFMGIMVFKKRKKH